MRRPQGAKLTGKSIEMDILLTRSWTCNRLTCLGCTPFHPIAAGLGSSNPQPLNGWKAHFIIVEGRTSVILFLSLAAEVLSHCGEQNASVIFLLCVCCFPAATVAGWTERGLKICQTLLLWRPYIRPVGVSTCCTQKISILWNLLFFVLLENISLKKVTCEKMVALEMSVFE